MRATCSNLKNANTTEIKKSAADPVVDVMLEQKKHLADNKYGGTMRLGAYPGYLKKGTMARAAYKKSWLKSVIAIATRLIQRT